MPLPRVRVEHRLPGRVRFRVEAEQEPRWFERLADYLAAQEHVEEVRINSRTGSVCVRHGGEQEALLAHVRDSDLVQLCEPEVHGTLQRIQGAVERTDERVISGTHGAVSLGSLSFFGLIGLGLYQAQRGKFLPAGMTLMNYALEILYRAAEKERELEMEAARATPGAVR